MENLFHKLFFTCEEATMKAEMNEQKALSGLDQMRLWMHMQWCALCTLFSKQNKKLNSILSHNHQHLKEVKVDDKTKLKWKSALETASTDVPSKNN
ncbi:MAG: hypothetical protein EP346_09405 [Bacteroidetes bacterium]|uniref:Zf-HC2 domain-containing protein n=1 Tax=Phaeocystidibacter marisrubri TaxID=1577780 RepID=A0A6L3ZI12_9FLAO|nr:hypothetical protein [Phaeocystidibacter marisrubri]KAB2817228.1 hypothetical protein F8C82_02215 [Phaeocystidibacter marisrubri]TNE28349.1 MAG: hypothetical protein EP346_09405 [Bacteroidota bacterium]